MSETQDGIPATAPRAGDRFPWLHLKFQANGAVEDSFTALDDMHFHLMVIGQPPPADAGLGLGGLLRIHALPADPANDAELARAHIPQPSFYLVRPDGHVGVCGTRLERETVASYASQHLRLAPERGPGRPQNP